MLPEKLPKLTKEGEVLSEAEWEYYFECRKKYDHYVSPEDTTKLIMKINSLNPLIPSQKDAFDKAGTEIPVPPSVALAIKKAQGIRALFERNLYKARLAYPSEF